MSTKEETKTEQEKELELLREYVKEGQTVYTILRHVSVSGTSQDISLMTINGNGELIKLTYSVATVLGKKVISVEGRNAIRESGGNRDMGFDLVYNLSSVLFAGRERAGYVLKHDWL